LNEARHIARKPVLLQTARKASVVHRWLGIGVGFMFAVWFATGTILSFWPFPELSHDARLASSEQIDLDAVRITPGRALQASGLPDAEELRLISVAGRPRFVVADRSRLVSVDAHDGTVLGPLDMATAGIVAARFGGASPRKVEGPLASDPWTVHDRYTATRPYYRVALDDPDGTVLYVAVHSGEVVQRTRRTERIWNQVGARIHWLNIGSLRAYYTAWHATIRTVATLAFTLALLGLSLGVIRWLNLRRQRGHGVSPFRGLLRWHHLLGLAAAFVLLNWITSGWLSLDEGTLFSSDRPSAPASARLGGVPLRTVAGHFEALMQAGLRGSREIDFRVLGSQPFVVAYGRSTEAAQLILEGADSKPRAAGRLPQPLLQRAVEDAWAPLKVRRIEKLGPDDPYALRSRPFPRSAYRLILDDASPTWVHIDAANGDVISVMDSSRRLYRWLVDGPHHLDFPWLNRAGPLWHVLLVMATAFGFAFSSTGIVLAARRLRAIDARRRTASRAGSGVSGTAS
jgi:hypothetical protein